MQSLAIFYPQKGFEWHEEDAWQASAKLPIYSVADGVTLPPQNYLGQEPPFGPKVAAEIFCREAVKYLEKHYQTLSPKVMERAYLVANKLIGKYNQKQKEAFSAVGVLAAFKDGKIFGSRLTDCGWAIIRRQRLFYKTPEFWQWKKSNRLLNYGVLNGSQPISQYLQSEIVEAAAQDFLLLFSDGFENHFSQEKFIRLFSPRKTLNRISQEVKKIDRELTESDHGRYGKERTLLIILLE